ncbi:ImmA/IrrE family metallo-endopeptidase, partial [Candidatus Poribacteria bacterium]|nr:ImmA/IrrE family metallo-endopeptidase [Candidatus Poribacteria bacterium]
MAKSVKALINPEVLKWVREKRIRLDLDLAAEKLKIVPERLTDWESGTAQPTFAQLKRIAKIYKTHISIFYLPKPPIDFHPLTDYRVLPQTTAPESEQTYRLKANILEIFDRRETLIDFYELLEMPFPEVTIKVNLNETPIRAAERIRKFLNFNTEMLPRTKDRYKVLKFWKRTVESKGILVCQTSANTHLAVELNTFRGFCIAQKPFPVIVVNSQDSPNGRIFTILHELVHIALGESIIQNINYEDVSVQNIDPVEAFCN